MCGIIGYHNKYVTDEDLKVLKKVLIESRIRGKHASGIAWFNGKSIHSYVKPIPIDELVDEFDLSQTVNSGEILLIAHARYSTSDIKYNQPLVGKHWAIAHNGVITQSNPDTWESDYGYACTTKNDSELLLHALEQDGDVFSKFPKSSMSCVAINDSGELLHFRNAIRPMWKGNIGKGVVYASTFDILRRAGVTGIVKVSSSNHSEMQNRSMYNGYEKRQ